MAVALKVEEEVIVEPELFVAEEVLVELTLAPALPVKVVVPVEVALEPALFVAVAVPEPEPRGLTLQNALSELKIDGVVIDDCDGEKPLLLVGVRKGEVEGDGEKVGGTSTRTSELLPCV